LRVKSEISSVGSDFQLFFITLTKMIASQEDYLEMPLVKMVFSLHGCDREDQQVHSKTVDINFFGRLSNLKFKICIKIIIKNIWTLGLATTDLYIINTSSVL